MKLTRTAAAIAAAAALQTAPAQNIQLHHDLGRALYNGLGDRQRLTTTFEMFRPDKAGSTFLFVDMDYQRDGIKGAYWEIAREFTIGTPTASSSWAAHAEYNGGLGSDKASKVATRYQHIALLGAAWNWHSADFSSTFSAQLMYRYSFKGANPWDRPANSFQATAVWGKTFAGKLLSFNGFFDLWHDKDARGELVFVTEPQLWINLNAVKGMEGVNLSLGTEVEISNNFVYDQYGRADKFYAIPTLGAKWTF